MNRRIARVLAVDALLSAFEIAPEPDFDYDRHPEKPVAQTWSGRATDGSSHVTYGSINSEGTHLAGCPTCGGG